MKFPLKILKGGDEGRLQGKCLLSCFSLDHRMFRRRGCGRHCGQSGQKVTADEAGKIYCHSGIEGRVTGISKTAEEAEKILAIDGYPLDCTKLSLERRDSQTSNT